MSYELAALRRRKKEEQRKRKEEQRKKRQAQPPTPLWEPFQFSSTKEDPPPQLKQAPIESAPVKLAPRNNHPVNGWYQKNKQKKKAGPTEAERARMREMLFGEDSEDAALPPPPPPPANSRQSSTSSIPKPSVAFARSPGSLSSVSFSQPSPATKAATQRVSLTEEKKDEEEDPLDRAMRLLAMKQEEKRRQQEQRKRFAEAEKREAERRKQDEEEIDRFEDIFARQQERKRNPHNPLTIEQLQEDEDEANDNVARMPAAASGTNLWSDNSDEELVKGESCSPRKPRKKRTSNGSRAKKVDSSEDEDDKKPSAEKKKKKKKKRSSTTKKKRVSLPPFLRPEDIASSLQDDDELEEIVKPEFTNPKMGPPSAMVPLKLPYSEGENEVPASINRYLKEYQRLGVSFIHNRFVKGKGAILGDDMGLGKTVQVIALLAALFEKTGTGQDLIELRERRMEIAETVQKNRAEHERALLHGQYVQLKEGAATDFPPNRPVLISVPSSVIQNWLNEFETWGFFGVSSYGGSSREVSLERIRNGVDEVLICSHNVFTQVHDLHQLMTVPWRLIIVDEAHKFKNYKTKGYEGIQKLRDACRAPMLGMTGTIMQNNHEELWSVIHLFQPNHLGELNPFKELYAKPIKEARTKTASEDQMEKADALKAQLTEKLKELYIRRSKANELADELPEKKERVLFCELTPIQKDLYQHILTLPDYVLLRFAKAPCDCGVNRDLFQAYKQLHNDREKLDFQRRKRKQIKQRWDCCHKTPNQNPHFGIDGDEYEFDPRAPLWRWQHQENEACDKCPYCLCFPAMNKLFKLSSHASLLQLDKSPDCYREPLQSWQTAMKDLEFAQEAIPEDIFQELPGQSYVRQDNIMVDHAKLSGKMKKLAELLKEFDRKNARLLLFSYSTQTLDMIQNFVKGEGYSHLRLDGTTPTKRRQELVDMYQNDPGVFLFLISTKAGGLGLNLTAANVVIIFDVEYNPSNDEQAQDRAYRLGQRNDVLVVRLVSRGTIEELKYIRQIYKVQLSNETMGDTEEGKHGAKSSRLFRAVQGDRDRKGELYGMENLLKFKDGAFMDDVWKSSAPSSPDPAASGLERFGLHSAEDILGMMTEDEALNMGNTDVKDFDDAVRNQDNTQDGEEGGEDGGESEEAEADLPNILETGAAVDHAAFLEEDKGDAALKEGDDGFDEEMGGMSQAAHHVFKHIRNDGEVDYAMRSDDEDSSAKPQGGKEVPSPVQSSARVIALEGAPTPVVSRPSPVASHGEVLQNGESVLDNDTVVPSPVRSSRPAPDLPASKRRKLQSGQPLQTIEESPEDGHDVGSESTAPIEHARETVAAARQTENPAAAAIRPSIPVAPLQQMVAGLVSRPSQETENPAAEEPAKDPSPSPAARARWEAPSDPIEESSGDDEDVPPAKKKPTPDTAEESDDSVDDAPKPAPAKKKVLPMLKISKQKKSSLSTSDLQLPSYSKKKKKKKKDKKK